jgi:hypothetical protein
MKCKKHPKYKAILRPRADCEDCRKMYAAKQEAKNPNEVVEVVTRGGLVIQRATREDMDKPCWYMTDT